MAYDEELAERIRTIVYSRQDASERKMFGGLAFMIGGNMCCGVVGSDLMVRVGADQYNAALAETGARPMDFTGRPMKGMVFVGSSDLADNALAAWVQRGAAYAESLPPK